MRAARSVVLGVAVLVVAAGCSKKKSDTAEDAGTGSEKGQKPGPGQTPKADPKADDVDALIADFRQKAVAPDPSDQGAGSIALTRLRAAVPPDHPRHRDVFRAALEVARTTKDLYFRPTYFGAAPPYAGREDVPELIAMVDKDRDLTGQTRATKRLAELADPASAEAAARWLVDPEVRLHRPAGDILRAIGPAAEKAVWPYTQPKLPDARSIPTRDRLQAIGVLREIGTPDSIPVLQTLLDEPQTGVATPARKAIEAIRQREKPPGS